MTNHTTFPSSSETPNSFGTSAFERRKDEKEKRREVVRGKTRRAKEETGLGDMEKRQAGNRGCDCVYY